MSENPKKKRKSIRLSKREHDPNHENSRKSLKVQKQLPDNLLREHLQFNYGVLAWLFKSLLIVFMPGEIHEGTIFPKFHIEPVSNILLGYSPRIERSKKCDLKYSVSFEYLSSSYQKVSNKVTFILEFHNKYQMTVDSTRFKIYYNIAAKEQKGKPLYMVVAYDKLTESGSNFPDNQLHQKVQVFSCPCFLKRETIEKKELMRRIDCRAPKVIEIGPKSVEEGKPIDLPKNAYYFFSLLFWPDDFEDKVISENIEFPPHVRAFWELIKKERSRTDSHSPEIFEMSPILGDEFNDLLTLSLQIVDTGAPFEEPSQIPTTTVEEVKKLLDSSECEAAKRTWFHVCALICALILPEQYKSIENTVDFVRSFIEDVDSLLLDSIILQADSYCSQHFSFEA